MPLPEVKMRTVPVVNLGQAAVFDAASPGEQWWSHHIENTRAYAEAALSGDEEGAVAALKELWKAVLDWQKLTGCQVAGALMGEHTVYAKLLADCFVTDAGEACTSTAVDAVGGNVEAHRKYFFKNPEEFVSLFGRHSELAGAYITDLAAGDMESFNRHFAEAIENGHQLAAFTDRVIVPLKHGLSGPRRSSLGQASPANYISTSDFRAYVEQANSSIKAIADIARAYDLSNEEIQKINSEIGKVSGFTLPMANVSTCEGPSPWLLLGAALVTGVIVGTAV
jgi:hypothetical protein